MINLFNTVLKGDIASTGFTYRVKSENVSLSLTGTITYRITDPDYLNAPIKDIEHLLKAAILCQLNDVI